MNINQKKELWSLILKGALLTAGIVGQITSAGRSGFMSGGHFLYFTIMSNLWIMAIVLVFFIYSLIHLIKGSDSPAAPNCLQAVRFIFTVAITLTFLVFSVLLTPQMISEGNSGYLLTAGNLCVHNLVPLLAIADFLIFGYKYKTSSGSFVLGLIMPLLYSAFALILSTMGSFFGGSKVPYFFFDYDKLGWLKFDNGPGVVYWLIILAAAVLGISRLFIYLKDCVAKRRTNSQSYSL